jgi:hypothetical protein
MRRATNLSYYIGQPVPNLSHDSRTLPPQAAHQQRLLLSGVPKAEIRRVSRTEVDSADAILYNNNKKWVLNKTLTSLGSLLPGSNLERAATREYSKAVLGIKIP